MPYKHLSWVPAAGLIVFFIHLRCNKSTVATALSLSYLFSPPWDDLDTKTGAGVWFLSCGPCFSHCKLSSLSVSTLFPSYIRGHIMSAPSQAFIKQRQPEKPSGQEVHPGTTSPGRVSGCLSSLPMLAALNTRGWHVMFSAWRGKREAALSK